VLTDRIEIMKNALVMFSRLIPWLMSAYIILMFAFTLSAANSLGYYGDELIHLEKIQVFLDHGLYALSNGENSAGELLGIRGHLYAYGPVFTLVAHLVTVIAGAETWGTIEYTDAAYAVRHIMVSVFAFVGVAAAGWAVAIVTQSRRWGLATGALLVSIPLWTGSAMFNLKDTPAATGYTLLTAGCIALTLPVDRLTRGMKFAGWLSMFGGTLLIWGVRPGLWPGIALVFFAMLLIRARFNNFSQWKESFSSLIYPLSAVAASYASMMLLYPKVFLNPFKFIYLSLNETANFPHDTFTLTNGEAMPSPPPWDYIPQWLAAQLPETVLVLLVASIAVSAWLVLRRLFASTESAYDFVIPALMFVFIQFAAFPVAAILLKSGLYGGLRQLLFLIPAAAILIMLSLFVLVRHSALRQIRGLLPAVAGVLVASTILTTVAQVQLFPYVTSYFNPTTFAGGIEGKWDVHARKMAVGELYSRLSLGERLRCKNCPPREMFPTQYAEPADARFPPLEYWQSIRFPAGRWNPAKIACPATTHVVSRPYLSGSISILELELCDIGAPPIQPEQPSGKAAEKWWGSVTHWGWNAVRANGVTSSPGKKSVLAWSMEPIAPGTTRSYVLDLSVLGGSPELVTLSIMVNGIALDDVAISAQGTTDLVIDVPPPSIEGAPDDLVVVEFVLTDGNGSPVSNALVVGAIRPVV